MKATTFIYDEDTDITAECLLYFDKSKLSSWYINLDGEINATIDGQMYTLKPDAILLNYLEQIY